jgi:hypothetical protein
MGEGQGKRENGRWRMAYGSVLKLKSIYWRKLLNCEEDYCKGQMADGEWQMVVY